MLNITLICVGNLKDKYWKDACAEYAKRMKSLCNFSVIEVDEERAPENMSKTNIENIVAKEGKRIAAKIPSGAKIVSMCIEGKQKSSEEFALELENFAVNGFGNIVFIIGGSWGLSPEIKAMSDIRMSMSKMTFPHRLARVMLCEQIYRAFQIIHNGKYHK